MEHEDLHGKPSDCFLDRSGDVVKGSNNHGPRILARCIVSSSQDQAKWVRERRTLISQVLVTGLVSVALSEPVGAVHSALQAGASIQSLALFGVFVLTVLRFLVGDILHLEDDEVTGDANGAKWFCDASFIVLECIILILVGSVASVSQNAMSHVGFFDLILLLYLLDIAWIMSISFFHLLAGVGRLKRVFAPMRRSSSDAFPVGWAMLNGALSLYLWRCGFLTDTTFSDGKLWVLLGVNILAFGIDVFVLNYGLSTRRRRRRLAEPDTR